MTKLYTRSSLGWVTLVGAIALVLTESLFQLEVLKAPYQQWGLIESNLSSSLVVVMPLVGGVAAVLQFLGHSPGRISTMTGTRISSYGQSLRTMLMWLVVSVVSVAVVLLVCVGLAIATAGGGKPEIKLYVATFGAIVFSVCVGHVIGYLTANLKASLVAVALLAVLPMSAVNGFSSAWIIPILPAEKLPGFNYSATWLNRQLMCFCLLVLVSVVSICCAYIARSRGVVFKAIAFSIAPIAVIVMAWSSAPGPVAVFELSAVARRDQVCETIGARTVCVHQENRPELTNIRNSLKAVDDVVGVSKAGLYRMKDSSLVDTTESLPYGVGVVEFKPGQGSRFGALLIEAVSGVLVCGPDSSESAIATSFEVNDWLLSRVPATSRETFTGEPDGFEERGFNDAQMEKIVREHSEDLSTCSYSGGANAGT